MASPAAVEVPSKVPHQPFWSLKQFSPAGTTPYCRHRPAERLLLYSQNFYWLLLPLPIYSEFVFLEPNLHIFCIFAFTLGLGNPWLRKALMCHNLSC